MLTYIPTWFTMKYHYRLGVFFAFLKTSLSDNNDIVICSAENTVQELRLFHDALNVSSEATLLHFQLACEHRYM